MTYNILTHDICGELSDYIVIVGGHFTEEKAKQILVRKKQIERNMIISDLNHGYAKKVTNMDEITPCAESNIGYLLDWSSVPPDGFDKKITIVEVCEDF